MNQQKVPDEELADSCEKLFDLLDYFTESNTKKKAAAWPLQMMLLILSPAALGKVLIENVQ